MALIYALLTATFAGLLYGPRGLALAAAVFCLLLSAGLFLFEIHSPEEGFSMPWLQVLASPSRPEPAA